MLKMTIAPGNTDDYVMLGCNDERIYPYTYANFDGKDYYWVNIDMDDYDNEIRDLAEWISDRVGETLVIEEDTP